MSNLKQIVRLRQKGVAFQRIAKATGTSRNTVKRYLKLIEIKGLSFSDILSSEDHEAEKLLADPREVSNDRYKELSTLFPYARFCHHLSRWMETKGVTMHFDHKPADKMFIDFTGKKLYWVDRQTGELHETEVYISILGYSQLLYVEALPCQKKVPFIQATENAFHYYGGVPGVLVPDNLKSAVHEAHKYEPVLNRDFADFANHYNTVVLPARSRKPRYKALVEKAVQIVYSCIFAPLRDRDFFSPEELNQAIKELLELCNNKFFQNQSTGRRQKFDREEKHLLHPLPAERYELKTYKRLTVMKNTHIQLWEDKHYYSVPYRYIGKRVRVVYSASRVSVFYDKERIAFHKREYRRFGYTTLKTHLPSTHQFISDWNPDTFLNRAARIDPAVKDYIAHVLEQKAYPEQAYRSCMGILALGKKAGIQRLIGAVKRASYYEVYNYKIIERIINGGLDRIEPEKDDQSIQQTLPFHENIRGKENYH